MKIIIAINNPEQYRKILFFAAQFIDNAGEPPTIMQVVKNKSEFQNRSLQDFPKIAQEILNIPYLTIFVRVGHAADVIIRETENGRFDLLISDEIPIDLNRIFLGTGTVHTINKAPCPVLIAKGPCRPIRRILLCDSGAGRSSTLSKFTAQLLDMLDGQEDVTVIHVMSQISAGPGVAGKQLRAGFNELLEAHSPEGELLERDIQLLDLPGINPRPLVAHGLVVDEILSEARKGDYDLIIIGIHVEKNLRRFLLENLANKILKQSDRPVLVVK